jgi:hypothetical protein
MKKYFKFIGCSFFLTCMWARADVYKPYFLDNPDRINWNNGYCENHVEEKKLWRAISKTSKSMHEALPVIPENKELIEEEWRIKNFAEGYLIENSSLYKLYLIKIYFKNIELLSSTYLKSHERLSSLKKIEIATKVLKEIRSIQYLNKWKFDEIDPEKSLEVKDVFVPKSVFKDLRSGLSSVDLINGNLIEFLQCIGSRGK